MTDPSDDAPVARDASPAGDGCRCPRCGTPFACGVAGAAPCACTTVPLTDAQRRDLAARHAGCLCLSCLREVQQGAPA